METVVFCDHSLDVTSSFIFVPHYGNITALPVEFDVLIKLMC